MDDVLKSTDELIALFKRYKIQINGYGLSNIVYIQRYGLVITYDQEELFEKKPKTVVCDIMKKFTKHPKYKEQTQKYIAGLLKKPTLSQNYESDVRSIILTVNEKKKLIREKLIKEGLI
jgi:hypothetical protein